MAYLRQSKWTYDTSATLGLSLGFSVISGSMISLNDPDRNPHHFHFGAFGVGISRGLALTRIEVPQIIVRNYDFSGSVALYDVIITHVAPLANETTCHESVRLSFSTMKHEYIVQNPLGGSGGTVTAMMYIKENSTVR